MFGVEKCQDFTHNSTVNFLRSTEKNLVFDQFSGKLTSRNVGILEFDQFVSQVKYGSTLVNWRSTFELLMIGAFTL